MKYGYARISTKGQSWIGSCKALEEVGCEKIITDKESGKVLLGRATGVWRDSYVVETSYTSNRLIVWVATMKKLLNSGTF